VTVLIPSLGVAFCWMVVVDVVGSLSGFSFTNLLEGGPLLMLETEVAFETCGIATLDLLENPGLPGDSFNFEGEPTTWRGSRAVPHVNLVLLSSCTNLGEELLCKGGLEPDNWLGSTGARILQDLF
jgi:hypothetical protein